MPETTAQARICVHVRLFASYREAAKTARLETSLAAGSHVSDLITVLANDLPVLLSARGMVAVNHAYVGADTVLQDGDEVALIPPVSGGAQS